MKLSEIASRLNGISTPFLGISWTPATSDVQVVRGLIMFLEGRRLLYNSHPGPRFSVESIRRVERSVSEIRSFLTDLLVKGGTGSELTESLRLLRQASMDCLSAMERWLDFLDANWQVQYQRARTLVHDPNVEDFRAHMLLFRETVNKIMGEVADAHGMQFQPISQPI